MAIPDDPFEVGTWWYNQGRSCYETFIHEGKRYYRHIARQQFLDTNSGKFTTEVVGGLRQILSSEVRASGWHWEALLNDGARMRVAFEGDRIRSSHLRPNSSDWRPPVIAKRGAEGQTLDAHAEEARKAPPEQLEAAAEAAARQKEYEKLLASVSFEALGSRIRRLALGVFLEPEVSTNVITSSGTTALRNGLSKAVRCLNELPSKVFDRLTWMPLERFIEERALEDGQDRFAESRRIDPKKTIVPVPAVRLCPGMLHPVSMNEEQMLRLFINAPLSMAYSLSSGLRNAVPLDAKASQLSQLIISGRHDVLRSAYRMDDFGNPSRKVEREHQGEQFMLCVKDVGDAMAIQGAEFSVANALGISSIRYNIELATNGWGHQGVNINHIMGDADAMQTYWNENFMIQGLLSLGFSEEAVVERLPPLPVQMVDFAYWQRSLACQGLLDSDVAVWYSDIASVHPPLTLDTPIDIPRRRAWQAIGENYFCHLSGDLISLLQEVNHRATPFAVVTAAFSIILSRLSGTPSIYMGTPFALRMVSSLQNLIGDFVNMIGFKVRYDPSDAFMPVLDRAAESAVDVQRYAMAPFLMFVNSVNRFYVTNDPARNPIYQTMIDVVPKDNEDPNPSMSGILDLFLFANTYRGQLWSIECTSNSTVLAQQTVRSILLMMPILIRQVSRDTKVEVPRSMPCQEEAHVVESSRLLLTHLRLKVGPLPHIVGVTSGWEYEGEPQECGAIRAARRLKAQSGLQLSADLPLTGARAQRPPAFIIRDEMRVQAQMAKQQEDRQKRKKQQEAAPPLEGDAAPAAPALPEPAEPAKPQQAALPGAPEAPEDPEAEILAEIEARRAQVRRKLAARSVTKGRMTESKLASELIGFDLGQPLEESRPRPRMRGAMR